ncbi:hypothetical protein CN611_06920 [Bacillus wiedmannii]|uniref:3-deoxy-7-phosphoheptulonate synthase n=1 Tax=Bacillus wiedmannii TaxID=1890302 RepID=A0A2B5XH56_9BACI|nr:hypothetical protein CN611_06920 [Bacillus wiedmannii]PGA95724.1 hypothetical protein COL92_22040 [Bacillus wiedmannii]
MFKLSFFIVSEKVRGGRATRNTLPISAVPILKKATQCLPVVADVTHSTGRRVPPNPAHQMTTIVVFCR